MLDSLVSYNHKEITHNDLSTLVKETLNNILFHFNLENDEESKNLTYINTYGTKYRPLGSKR